MTSKKFPRIAELSWLHEIERESYGMVAANKTYMGENGQIEDCLMGEDEEVDEGYFLAL